MLRAIREEKESEKKESVARNGRQIAETLCFPMFCGSGGSESRLAKAAVPSHLAGGEIKSCMRLAQEANFFKDLNPAERFEVELLKKCMRLWCGGRFEVNKLYTLAVGAKHMSKPTC